MNEQLEPSSKLSEGVPGVRNQARESIIKAQRIYQNVQEHPSYLNPPAYSYLEALAGDESSNPEDVLELSKMMEVYPQLKVDITENVGGRIIALTMAQIAERQKFKLKISQDLGLDLEQEGKQIVDTLTGLMNLKEKVGELDIERTLKAREEAMNRTFDAQASSSVEKRPDSSTLSEVAIPNVIWTAYLEVIARQRLSQQVTPPGNQTP